MPQVRMCMCATNSEQWGDYGGNPTGRLSDCLFRPVSESAASQEHLLVLCLYDCTAEVVHIVLCHSGHLRLRRFAWCTWRRTALLSVWHACTMQVYILYLSLAVVGERPWAGKGKGGIGLRHGTGRASK